MRLLKLLVPLSEGCDMRCSQHLRKMVHESPYIIFSFSKVFLNCEKYISIFEALLFRFLLLPVLCCTSCCHGSFTTATCYTSLAIMSEAMSLQNQKLTFMWFKISRHLNIYRICNWISLTLHLMSHC